MRRKIMNVETEHYMINRDFPSLGKWLMVGVCLIFISGCVPESNDDLHRYVQSIKARKAAKIAPLPDFKSYETYAYSASGKRDPFQPMQDDDDVDDVATAGPGLRPDLSRHKEALEAFPLDTLHFVGDLAKGDQAWVIITAPDGLVYRVSEGNYLGKNHGRITEITESRIAITEIIPDGIGGWIERQAALSLTE
jgi:type IV pilus assembly protein PilP